MEHKQERWQIPPLSPSPWLVYTHGKAKSKNIQTFCTITGSNPKSYIKSIPALRDKRILGTSHGWLILQHLSHNNMLLFLWDPVTSNLIELPPINAPDFAPTMAIKSCILSCSPHDNHNCIVLIFCESFAFTFRLDHDQQQQQQQPSTWVSQWIEVEVTQTINANNNGVFYALAYTKHVDDNLEVIGYDYHLITLNVDDNNEIILANLDLDFPSPDSFTFPFYNRFQYSLIESCGIVYMVGIFMWPRNDFDYIRFMGLSVWHLDLETRTWVKVDSIDDRAFFFDKNKGSSAWCWANNEVGVEPNSVYFLGPKKHVYMYRLHDRGLTPLCPCPNLVKPWDPPVWVIMPHHHQRSLPAKLCDQQVNDIVDSEKLLALDQNRTLDLDDLMSLLPTELIVLVSKHLHMFDYLSFREVCKSFRSQLPLPKWRTHNTLPLFLYSKKDGGLCQIMDSCRNDSRFISTPLPSRYEKFIDFSKNGWLIFGMGGASLNYFNLFTGVSGDFPTFNPMQMRVFTSIGFSTCPTSPDCMTVGIFGGWGDVLIAYHFYGEEDWKIEMFKDEEFEFYPGASSPVFFDGEIYFLDQKGYLGVFKLEEGEPDMIFYDKPELKNANFYSNHLVECDGQILSVFIGDMGTWVQVFRFSHLEEKWVKLKDLRNNILFINHNTSFSVVAPEPGMGNRIYLSMLHHNDIVYYSLETGKFHTFGDEHAMDDLYGTEEQLRCCWV